VLGKKVTDTYILRLDNGEDIISSIKLFCEQNGITAGVISGFGVASKVKLICFNWKTQAPEIKVFENDYEITSLLGNISNLDDDLFIHLHITMTDEKFNAFGRHLVEGKIRHTGEIIIRSIHTRINRTKYEELDINILDL